MNPTITANINSAECIKEIANIGYTRYVNICAETSIDVPWGTMNWVLAGLLGGLVVFVVLFFVVLILSDR